MRSFLCLKPSHVHFADRVAARVSLFYRLSQELKQDKHEENDNDRFEPVMQIRAAPSCVARANFALTRALFVACPVRTRSWRRRRGRSTSWMRACCGCWTSTRRCCECPRLSLSPKPVPALLRSSLPMIAVRSALTSLIHPIDRAA